MIDFFLTADGGNTLTKYALFDKENRLLERVEVDVRSLKEKYNLTSSNTVCALVDVARPREAFADFPVYDVKDFFSEGRFLEMTVHYTATLGLDRLALAYFFYSQKAPVALIDSGTFTTIDLIDSNGFQGGHILPGLEILLDAYDFGYQLKKMKPKAPLNETISLPRASEESMASGLTHSFYSPIVSILADMDFEDLYITGGNGLIVYKWLKKREKQRSASIHFDPDLIHKGLLQFLRKVAQI